MARRGRARRQRRFSSLSPQRGAWRRTERSTRTLGVEPLEAKLPLASFVVTNTATDGEGSLAAAIESANASAGGDTILFNIDAPAPLTIFVTSLPTITDSVVIDATTQPGYVDRPLIAVRGVENEAGGGSAGLTIQGDNSVVRGLALSRFVAGSLHNGSAITLRGNNHRVEGSWLGVNSTGTAVEANTMGVLIEAGSGHVVGGSSVPQRNIIAGNHTGVAIRSNNNQVVGNWIGIDIAGRTPLPNQVGLELAATGNVIGGASPAQLNLISGNQIGIVLGGSSNRVQGNRIGTDESGTMPLANQVGIRIDGESNVVGGDSVEVGNLISGNTTGVLVRGNRNQLQGNLIGTDVAGNLAVGNATGVHIVEGLENAIGGAAAGQGNVISANETGVLLEGARSTSIQGNFVGIDRAGTNPLGNRDVGIRVAPGENLNNRIGGTQSGAINIIAATQGFGVAIEGSGNFVQGNRIGRNALNPEGFANLGGGVLISGSNNRVGGTEPNAGNVISGNTLGIRIAGASATNNLVQANAIGVDFAGRSVGNQSHGIELSASGNTIGSGAAGAGNTISANGTHGIWIHGTDARGNMIQGNQIGTDVAGTLPMPNQGDGIRVENTGIQSSNMIGGTTPDQGNRIVFNRGAGVAILQPAGANERSTGTQIRLNQIAENVGLGIDLGPRGIPDGVTPNDPGDVDTGPNELQNFPELTSFVAGSSTRITGRLDSQLGVTYVIDFYISPTVGAAGQAEGRRYLGSTTVGPDELAFDVELAVATQPLDYVTATATATAPDSAHGTSEFSPLGTIEGTKRLDLLKDGVTDDDPPLADFSVSLYVDDGDGLFDETLDLLIESAVTDADGRYRFASARPGRYFVVDPTDDRYLQTAGGDQFPDIPFYNVDMVSHGHVAGLDFANYKIPTLGGKKVVDIDYNGVTDGDPPLADWSIELYRDNGDRVFNANVDELVEAAVTDEEGRYAFTGMEPGHYYVVEVLRGDYEQTGGGDAFPSTPYYARSVVGGTEHRDLDFANFDFPDFRGIKFFDISGDGISSDDERHPGNVIQLWRDDGDDQFDPDLDLLERIDVTDLEGRYDFIRIVPGTYHVVDVVPENYVQTGGGDDFPARPYYTIEVENEINHEELHFSNAKTASIAGRLFTDRTADGFSHDDPFLIGGNVLLYRDTDRDRRFNPPADERVGTLTSGDDGTYRMEGIPPGRYFVMYEPQARVRQTAGGDAFPLRPHYVVDLLSGQDVEGKDFASAPFHPTGFITRSMAASDFDGDGDMDVVVVNEQVTQFQITGNAVMLLNDGAANFPTMRSIGLAGRPQSIFAADLDGNRADDLVVTTVGDGTPATAAQNRVIVMYNAGDGHFFQHELIGNVGDGPMDVAAADFDRDGDLDLAVVSFRSNDVTILLNQGRGHFTHAGRVVVGSQPVSIVAHHLNGDAAIDLVVAEFRSNRLSLLVNNGRGGFTRTESVATVPGPSDLAVADWDGNGQADVAVAGFSGDQVGIHYGLRTGAAADGGDRRAYVVGSPLQATRPQSVWAVDYDADGDLDIVVAASAVSAAVVLENRGERAFTIANVLPTAGGPQSVVAEDLDGNQSPDIASTTLYRAFADVFPQAVSLGGVNVTHNRNADVSATISNDRNAVIPGERLTYTLRVRNNGPNRLEGITVESELPPELLDVVFTSSISGAGSGNTEVGEQLIDDVVNLDRGSEVVYLITGTIDPSVRGIFQVAARTTVPDHFVETNLANNRAVDRDDVLALVDISVNTDDGLADEGHVVTAPGEFNFTVTASNAGPAAATDVSFANQFELPAGTRIAATITTKGIYDLQSRRWTVGELAVDETVRLTIIIRIDALATVGDEIRHRVFVDTLAETDANVSNNLSAAIVTIGPAGEVPGVPAVSNSLPENTTDAELARPSIPLTVPTILPPSATPGPSDERTEAIGVVLSGDFDGDGLLDSAQWLDGRWTVRTKADHVAVDWGPWSNRVDWLDLLAGDVDGDGKDDIVGRTAAGLWWVGLSTGNAFHNERWGRWSDQVRWSDVSIGDVTGDGLADLVGRTHTGQWWISASTGRELVHHRAADLLAAQGLLETLGELGNTKKSRATSPRVTSFPNLL